jgi:hypothetical protein
VAFTPDQRSLAVGHETGLTLVSLPSGDFTQPVRLRPIFNVTGSRRGAVAIEAHSGDIVDATSGRVIFAGGGYAAALSGDGAHLATSPSPGVVLITRQSFPRISFRIEHGSSDIRELALSESRQSRRSSYGSLTKARRTDDSVRSFRSRSVNRSP